MKVVFLSRSDLRGGAAIVTYRLMTAMRGLGVDARMLVCEKLSDSPYVDYCAPKWKIRYSFLKERLDIYCRNGFDRSTLFKIDTASDGLPVWRHPWVSEADAIYLGWVNQGMVSLRGIRRLSKIPGQRVKSRAPIVWVMHDMWNMTGICHHAGTCQRYKEHCGECPLLGKKASYDDLSLKTWQRKKRLYDDLDIRFVAVSSWLAAKAEESALLKNKKVEVIPNPFPLLNSLTPGRESVLRARTGASECIRIIFGAARLDDPIKGLPILKEALRLLRESHPEDSADLELVTFGSVRNPESLEGFAIPTRHLGVISGEDSISKAYAECDIVVSSSDFETLPGTLIEGQAYGCIPVAFDHGGQCDIIDHMKTGYLAPWNDDPDVRAALLAEGILWACAHAGDSAVLDRMRQSVIDRFSAPAVARRMLALAQYNPPGE